MMDNNSGHFRLAGIFSLILLITATGLCSAQNVLIPGKTPFETKKIKSGKYEMACFLVHEGKDVEVGSFTIDINANAKTVSVFTVFDLFTSNEQRIDTVIADGNTFQPIYRSSFNKSSELILNYGKEVTGAYFDKQNRKKRTIKEPITDAVFDSYSYPYLLGALPLASGYSASIPVYDYKPTNANNIKKALLEEVTSNVYTSKFTGAHKVWQVTVFEEATSEKYVYYLDKETRRIWKVEIFSKAGQHVVMTDKEAEENTIKSPFDKVATMKLIKSGSAVISGQAFARDNQNEGKVLGGGAILNINKKQFAPQGTSIVLIPYTDFFKEWVKRNEASRKKGTAIPLPQEAADCIKATGVYDDKGHFEFVNLMPGEYLVFTEFGYVHTSIRSEVTGYTDTYINGLYQGTATHTTSNGYNSNATASVKKVVRITKEGEKVEIKLKKTL